MRDELVVVTGASGHVGRPLTELLLAGHRRVRVVARRQEELRTFGERGAEVLAGSLEDPAFARRAFAGAHAAFTLIPPTMAAADLRGWQNRVSEAVAGGLRAARVRYVVNLSSIGAEVPYGTGPIAGLHDHEERLDGLEGVSIVHLRPASFMENHLQSIGIIRSQGVNTGTIRGELPLPMIAARDVAHEAATLLAGLEFEDKSTRELLGPRDYTRHDATRILGAAIGKPDLAYVRVSDHEAHLAMVAQGLPPHMVDMLLEMFRSIDSGKIHPAEPRLPENTTPTTLEDWAASIFAPIYKYRTPADDSAG
jgi:uncharacterized protein YbjT (DUF2867 family)